VTDLREAKRIHREQGKRLREAERAAGITAGESHRQYVAERRRESTLSAQDIGDIPPIADRVRRRDCLQDFELFCTTYGSNAFYLPWADSHRTSGAKIQQAADHGGWFAFAEPRGGGKTTRARWGAIWAILKGAHLYVSLIGANLTLAERLLKGIKTEFLTNELLLADFPHVCFPIRKLQGEARRATGQKYKGVPTHIEWQSNRIVLPWIPDDDNLSSGAVIESHGLDAAIRGPQHTLPDGRIIRPSFVLADDPQTRASAKSPSQTQMRLELLTGDVAYLAGPDQSIAIVCPCTVIYEGDLADQLLDRDKHPEWNGERTKMVESFPTNTKLWDDYADILRASWRDGGKGEEATEFYRQHREAMDEGAKVSWPERFKPNELSGIQSAINLRIKDEAAFFAECQNEPLVQQEDVETLTADEIAKKVTNWPRGVVPPDCAAITAFADVQKEHLFYVVVAWKPDFTGYIIDYGAWPDQKRNYFTKREIRNKLSTVYAGDESAQMFAAMTDLGKKLAGPYTSADGRELSLARWCIDINWREREASITTYARQSDLAPIITLTTGRGVKASENPFSQAQRAIKWKTGPGWFWSDGPGPARDVVFDTNLWKSRVNNALVLATESVGSIQLFKATPQQHRMFADHLCSEKPIKTEAMSRTVYEWKLKPGQDNEGLDGLVGCALGASIIGINRTGETLPRRQSKRGRRITYAK
jgi:Phage terminase large subunit (GpA)